MRPQTYVGVLGLLIAIVGGFAVDQASDGSDGSGGSDAAFIPLLIVIAMMGAAWLVRWPGDTDDAREARGQQRDQRVRQIARTLRR